MYNKMKSNFVIGLLAVFSIVYAGKERSLWGYEQTVLGPGDWGLAAPVCSGRFQSPVDIITASADTNSSLGDLVLAYDDADDTITGSLSNNGHAPTVILDKTKGGVTLVGGPLGQATFRLVQVHFHFGCDNNFGSEHTLNGKSYSAEMHLVFHNTLYDDFKEASSKTDGLAVIGLFMEVSGGFNEWMEDIAPLLRNVKFPSGNEITLINLFSNASGCVHPTGGKPRELGLPANQTANILQPGHWTCSNAPEIQRQWVKESFVFLLSLKLKLKIIEIQVKSARDYEITYFKQRQFTVQ